MAAVGGAVKGVQKTRWKDAEIKCAIRVLAARHVATGAPLNGQTMREIAMEGGEGFRKRKDLPAVYWKNSILKSWAEEIEQEVKSLQKVKQQQDQQRQEQAAQAEAAKATASAPEAHPSLPATVPPTLPTPAAQPEPVEAAGAQPTLGQMIDAAVGTMIDNALAKQAGQIMNALTTIFADIPGFQRFVLQQRLNDGGRKTVYIVNADKNQLRSVIEEFPFLDIDGGHQLPDEMVHPDLVIGVNAFDHQPLGKKLRKRFGGDFVPVFGGADSIKSMIRARLVNPALVARNGAEQSQLAH